MKPHNLTQARMRIKLISHSKHKHTYMQILRKYKKGQKLIYTCHRTCLCETTSSCESCSEITVVLLYPDVHFYLCFPIVTSTYLQTVEWKAQGGLCTIVVSQRSTDDGYVYSKYYRQGPRSFKNLGWTNSLLLPPHSLPTFPSLPLEIVPQARSGGVL